MGTSDIHFIKQHLIDPEICIRCNTCEATCPVNAITHDDRNYVVRADVCNYCMACIAPCPTGSIDNWRMMPKAKAYSIDEQLTWDELPEELTTEQVGGDAVVVAEGVPGAAPAAGASVPVSDETASEDTAPVQVPYTSAMYGATLPPWSAAHPFTNLYGPGQSDASVLARILAQLSGSGPLRLRSLDPIRDFCWVEDAANAILDWCARGLRGAFNVGSGESLSIGALARRALIAADQAGRAILAEVDHQTRSVVRVDIGDTTRACGWVPRTTLEEGLQKMIGSQP